MAVGAPVRIVLIEDNPGDVLLVRYALERLGLEFTLTCYADEPEAIRGITGWPSPPPDLFLIDLSLPCGDGFTILREIRARELLARTPVAILSSSQSPRDHAEAAALGANQFVPKPSDFDEFMQPDRRGGPESARLYFRGRRLNWPECSVGRLIGAAGADAEPGPYPLATMVPAHGHSDSVRFRTAGARLTRSAEGRHPEDPLRLDGPSRRRCRRPQGDRRRAAGRAGIHADHRRHRRQHHVGDSREHPPARRPPTGGDAAEIKRPHPRASAGSAGGAPNARCRTSPSRRPW